MGTSRSVAAVENHPKGPRQNQKHAIGQVAFEEQRGARGKRHRTTLAHELGSIGLVKSGVSLRLTGS